MRVVGRRLLGLSRVDGGNVVGRDISMRVMSPSPESVVLAFGCNWASVDDGVVVAAVVISASVVVIGVVCGCSGVVLLS